MVALVTTSNGFYPVRTYNENGITYRLVWDLMFEEMDFYKSFNVTYNKLVNNIDNVLVIERFDYHLANKPHWGL